MQERHVRTLLRQAQEAGWLEWQRSQDAESAGNYAFWSRQNRSQCDDGTGAGNRKAARCAGAAQLAPGELRTLLQPFMGGQCKTIRPRCVFPTIARSNRYNRLFARPCRAASRRTDIFRPDRFDNNTQRPIGDLAHHWETSLTGYAGTFIFVQPYTGITASSKSLTLTPAVIDAVTTASTDELFISVKRIEVTHPQCLTFFYIAPITGLRTGWRATAAICASAIPPDRHGSFSLNTIHSELVRLESHDYYHLRHPLLKALSTG